MGLAANNSPEVVAFLGKFRTVKNWCEDDPGSLVALADGDEKLSALCGELHFVAEELKQAERHKRELYAWGTNPAFLAAWRDFEERYYDAVSDVAVLSWLGFGVELPTAEGGPTNAAVRRWESADSFAESEAWLVDVALDFAKEQVSQEWRKELAVRLADEVADGVAVWKRLTGKSGFDLRGVLRRRALTPFVLVPRHVVARQGDPTKAAMVRNLVEAHEAFVYGAHRACLAMMRSTLEAILKSLYHADGDNLSQRINAAQGLPQKANKPALHRLRTLANGILHLDDKPTDRPFEIDDPSELEREIVSFLLVLRGSSRPRRRPLIAARPGPGRGRVRGQLGVAKFKSPRSASMLDARSVDVADTGARDNGRRATGADCPVGHLSPPEDDFGSFEDPPTSSHYWN